MNNQRGFALLIAVIFMSVMLAFGLALSSLGYKQKVLASSATDSQYAFYAADAGLECVLYHDQKLNTFDIGVAEPVSYPKATCDGGKAPLANGSKWVLPWSDERIVVQNRFSLDNDTRCVDVTIYKPSQANKQTFIFAQGYSASCDIVANPNGQRFVARGVNVHY